MISFCIAWFFTWGIIFLLQFSVLKPSWTDIAYKLVQSFFLLTNNRWSFLNYWIQLDIMDDAVGGLQNRWWFCHLVKVIVSPVLHFMACYGRLTDINRFGTVDEEAASVQLWIHSKIKIFFYLPLKRKNYSWCFGKLGPEQKGFRQLWS